MSQAFNNIDIASDLSEFEKEFKMQQSIKQYTHTVEHKYTKATVSVFGTLTYEL
jgi:hypothetical protein